MITEDYVSFEVAKLLKDKGFDENCVKVYINEELRNVITKESIEECTHCFNHYLYPGDAAAAPTLQMAMKWLRKAHHLHIIPEISDVSRLNPQYYVVIWLTTSKRESYILELFDSYEESCEAAIKYCLKNLI